MSRVAGQTPHALREKIRFNSDWLFSMGDPDGTGNQLSYAKTKAWMLPTSADFLNAAAAKAVRPDGDLGGGVSYIESSADDSHWRHLDLPHDWGIEGPFKQEYSGDTGKLPFWGIAWYRKHFNIPAEDKDKRIYLDIDGAMSFANIWLNGKYVGGWPYGYSSFRVDLTPYLKFGEENVVAIRLDNPSNSSRWYPGGGIYRNVWLEKSGPIHVAQWGVFVTTPEVKDDHALIEVRAIVQNDSSAAASAKVSTRLFELDANGSRTGDAVVSSEPIAATKPVAVGRQASLVQTLVLANPKRWDIKSPHRYVAVVDVEVNGAVVDEYETPFGVRTISFTADNGFLLNGRRVPLNGVCEHHDLGALGSAINSRALERQLQILQEMGCNAIRTSHNPPAPELLELCDRMGLVVMDEAFDCWQMRKRPYDYNQLFADWHEQDLRAMVRRDRNHPSIVLWSVGNEIPEQGQPEGWKLASHLSSIVHEEDTSRLTTMALNDPSSGFNGFQTALGVVGYNYRFAAYGRFHASAPLIPVIGSETASAISSRGEYFFPVSDNKLEGRSNFQVNSYDLSAPPWATTSDTEFRAQDEFPFVGGEFVWTGFDYLGEPTPYNSDTTNLLNFTDPVEREKMAKELEALGKINVPSRSSYFGIVDLAGFKKDRFFLYQARWRPDFPLAHILPHWNWPERIGQVTPVHVYTSGDEAELFRNGQSLGRKKKGRYEYRLRWDDVKYAPGELHVIAYKNDKKWAEDTVKTTGPAAKIALSADQSVLKADGSDLAFITVSIADKDGSVVPRSKNHVHFSIDGPGEIVATDNGDATSFESFQAPERNAFNGLALAIVRTKHGETGKITVHATSDGLAPAEVSLTANNGF